MRIFLKLNFILILLAFIASCSPIEEKGDEDSNAKFYDVVYQVVSTRENKNYAWKPVSGFLQMKIVQSSETEGTFQFRYNLYQEPQFTIYPNAYCSGGYKGNIEALKSGVTNSNTDVNGAYNPNSSYTSTVTTDTTIDLTDPSDPTKTISSIKTFIFKLTLDADSNLNIDDDNDVNTISKCHQETDRTVYIYRFANGELVMVNDYREMRMIPVLTNF